jgi:hypothetical protein
MFLDLFAGDQKEELLRWHYRERNQERLVTSWGELRFLLSPLTPAQLTEQETAEALGSLYRPTRWLSPLVVGLLLAILAGLLRAEHRPALFLAAVVGITLLISAALVGEVPRYRYPLDPLIGVLAVGGYAWALRAAWAGLRRRSPSLGQARPLGLRGR